MEWCLALGGGKPAETGSMRSAPRIGEDGPGRCCGSHSPGAVAG